MNLERWAHLLGALLAVRIGPWIQLESAAANRLLASPVLSRAEYLRFTGGAREYAVLARQPQTPHLRIMIPALSFAWLAGILALAGEQSIRRSLSVLLHPRCSIPFTCGLLRPVILLPACAGSRPPNTLRSALTHELAHVHRRDVLIQSIGYAVCLLFWFMPPVWLAYSALLRETETCCDQQVINRGIRGPEYARDIVELARTCRGRILLPSISSAIGKNVLSLKPGRFSFGLPDAARILTVCLCCLVPLLAVTCATKPSLVKTNDPVFGTWINPAYDGEKDRPGKWILFPDGRELDYIYIADTQPYAEGRNIIKEAWIDANGDRWYKQE
jgi:hypothetical protein